MSVADGFLQDDLPYDAYRYHPAPAWTHKGLRVFQMRLRMLGGRNPHDEPRLRIMWGPDITRYWQGKHIPKYIVAKAQQEKRTPEGVIYFEPVYYGYPHFFVEKWRAPEQMTQTGTDPERDWQQPIINRDRMGNTLELNIPEGLDTTRKVEDCIGEFPRAGRYDYFYRINPPFREPDDNDFELIQKRWKESVKLATIDVDTLTLLEQSARDSAAAARSAKYADAYGKDLLKNFPVLSRGAAGRKARVILPHDRPDQEEKPV